MRLMAALSPATRTSVEEGWESAARRSPWRLGKLAARWEASGARMLSADSYSPRGEDGESMDLYRKLSSAMFIWAGLAYKPWLKVLLTGLV